MSCDRAGSAFDLGARIQTRKNLDFRKTHLRRIMFGFDTGGRALFQGSTLGFDILVGGAGNDTIVTYESALGDQVYGGTGNDVINGIAGARGTQYLYSDDGNDMIIGGSGNNYIDGGQGND